MKRELSWPYEGIVDRLDLIPDDKIRAFFYLVYATGAREGEALMVKKEDIYSKETEQGEFIYINLLTEKNRMLANRHIPISCCNKQERDLAITLKCFSIAAEPGKYIFFNEPIKTTSKLRKIRRLSEKFLGKNPHFLRHCRLTHLVTEFNFNEYELVKYAGWTDSRPAKYYIHLQTSDIEKSFA